jgi:hypothetical protein
MGGVRNALDRHVDRAVTSRSFEAVYLGSMVATSAVCAVLLWVGRRLSR